MLAPGTPKVAPRLILMPFTVAWSSGQSSPGFYPIGRRIFSPIRKWKLPWLHLIQDPKRSSLVQVRPPILSDFQIAPPRPKEVNTRGFQAGWFTVALLFDEYICYRLYVIHQVRAATTVTTVSNVPTAPLMPSGLDRSGAEDEIRSSPLGTRNAVSS